jgi:hypothetical protein
MEQHPEIFRDLTTMPEVIELYTGIDFEYDEEILDLMTDTIYNRGIPRDILLFCGYSVNDLNDNISRKYIFANTLDEFRSGQELGPASPLQHAVDTALIDGGRPAVSVYDARMLSQDRFISDKYHARTSDVHKAHIIRFVIN